MIENINPSFESLVKKLYEVYQQVDANNTSIDRKQPDLTSTQLENNWFQNILFVYDTGEVANNSSPNPTTVTLEDTLNTLRNLPNLLFPYINPGDNFFPDGVPNIPTYDPSAGALLPLTATYNFSAILPYVTKDLIPFLEYENRFTAMGDKKVVAGFVWEEDFWDGDYYRVTYDGKIIWEGVYPPDENIPMMDWQYSNGFATYTTPAYQDSVSEAYLLSWFYTTSSGLVYGVDPNTGDPVTDPSNEFYISPYTESYVQFSGSVYGNDVISWTTDGEGHLQTITVSGLLITQTYRNDVGLPDEPAFGYTNNFYRHVTVTPTTHIFDLTSNDNGSLTWYGRLGGGWSSAEGVVADGGYGSSYPIFSQNGYYATFDANNEFPFFAGYWKETGGGPTFSYLSPGVTDFGGFQWLAGVAFPNNPSPIAFIASPFEDGSGPFTMDSKTVQFEINPEPYPQTFSERMAGLTTNNPYDSTDNSVPNFNNKWPVWVQGVQTDPFYIRLSQSADTKESWQVQYPNSCVVALPGTKNVPTSRKKWDDSYTTTQYFTYGYLTDGYDTSTNPSATLNYDFINWGNSPSSTTHDTISLPQYEAVPEDITARVRVAMRPPLNWHKLDKYQSQPRG